MINSLSTTLKSRLLYGRVLGSALAAGTIAMAIPAYAQQTGSINGQVMGSDGTGIGGVTVTASSPVMPTPRSTVTDSTGYYQLPSLVPGTYTLTYTRPSGETMTQDVPVLLQQRLRIDATFGGDELIVTGQKVVIDTGQASLKNSIGDNVIDAIPIGQEYRDIQKLIPGVSYSENSVRGPSAGGNGQDNTYQFDGVDVTLPLFGTLSAEPSSHDIDQVSIVRGGAKAIGFNRSGGFLINTISKRGTDEWHGDVQYQFQTSGMTADREVGDSVVKSETDRDWITASLGGPILKDKLYFYGSYYRPTVTRKNGTNVYGDVPDFKSTRDEFFGKLTFAPTDQLLLDVSYRTSDRTGENTSVGGFSAATTAEGEKASQDIIIAEGSFVLNSTSDISFKFTDYTLKTSSLPVNLTDAVVTLGQPLPVGSLDTIGQLNVPTLITGNADQNAFVQPLINRYGFNRDGVATGGGQVGYGPTINNQDFFRTNFEVAYNKTFNFDTQTHDFHIGYQYQEVEEDLARLSNGYGNIRVPAGTTTERGFVPYYVARVDQMGLTGEGANVPDSINSSSKLQSIEVNDTIEWNDWTFDIGVLFSNDTLYGQGLRENRNNISGFEVAPGNKYKMYEVNWNEMIQPRLGARYDWTDNDSVYASFARYNPSASSLARAASWDRNLRRQIDIYYDADGSYLGFAGVGGSSGKFFQAGLDPRFVNEYLVGWDHIFNDSFTGRVHYRHRDAGNFWEDVPNNSRLYSDAPQHIQDLGLYVPDLGRVRDEIGGSSYVIAQLDDGYTDYDELGVEGEYQAENFYLMGSYTFSKYEGNFDQDNTTYTNDANTFIGSSFIGDGRGRQLWNYRDGKLRGDIPHKLKLYGYYDLPWNGRFGGYTIYQSGAPWETWDGSVYGSSSSTARYVEKAGSRREKSHFQMDLNYTQNFAFNRLNFQIRADLFNVFNSQTGYNIDPIRLNNAGYGLPRSYYLPRRLQLAFKTSF